MLKILLILFLSTTTIYAENKNFIKLITDCSDKVQNNYADNQKIPLELLLAQAIIESNWGKSRFAIEGNNYFGIRTWDDNVPQLKPLKRPDATFGLQVYKDACESVKHYIDTLNTSNQYNSLRKIRKLELKLWGKVDPEVLAMGLINYSEEKDLYISKVKEKIRILKERSN